MSHGPLVRRAAVLGLLLGVVAGCGSGGGGDVTSSTPDTSLEGTHWLLQDTDELSTNGVSVTAEFADGRVGGTGGCNTYNAPYVVDGKTLTIGPDITSTRMACEPGPTAVETAYLAALPEVREYKVVGTGLQLLGSDGETVLSYTAADGTVAILGEWTATNFYTGNAVQSVAVDSLLTANFDADEVSGDGGCNTFGGPYTAGKRSISMGPFRSTLKACADPALQGQEQQYLAALEVAATYRVTGDQLELFRADEGIAATFVRTAVAGE
jgi:heat shock protein HslJ